VERRNSPLQVVLKLSNHGAEERGRRGIRVRKIEKYGMKGEKKKVRENSCHRAKPASLNRHAGKDEQPGGESRLVG